MAFAAGVSVAVDRVTLRGVRVGRAATGVFSVVAALAGDFFFFAEGTFSSRVLFFAAEGTRDGDSSPLVSCVSSTFFFAPQPFFRAGCTTVCVSFSSSLDFDSCMNSASTAENLPTRAPRTSASASTRGFFWFVSGDGASSSSSSSSSPSHPALAAATAACDPGAHAWMDMRACCSADHAFVDGGATTFKPTPCVICCVKSGSVGPARSSWNPTRTSRKCRFTSFRITPSRFPGARAGSVTTSVTSRSRNFPSRSSLKSALSDSHPISCPNGQ